MTYDPHQDVLNLIAHDNNEKFQLTFEGIRSFHLEFDIPFTELIDFHINDVSDNQLESVRYRVYDETPGQMYFDCLTADIKII